MTTAKTKTRKHFIIGKPMHSKSLTTYAYPYNMTSALLGNV